MGDTKTSLQETKLILKLTQTQIPKSIQNTTKKISTNPKKLTNSIHRCPNLLNYGILNFMKFQSIPALKIWLSIFSKGPLWNCMLKCWEKTTYQHHLLGDKQNFKKFQDFNYFFLCVYDKSKKEKILESCYVYLILLQYNIFQISSIMSLN